MSRKCCVKLNYYYYYYFFQIKSANKCRVKSQILRYGCGSQCCCFFMTLAQRRYEEEDDANASKHQHYRQHSEVKTSLLYRILSLFFRRNNCSFKINLIIVCIINSSVLQQQQFQTQTQCIFNHSIKFIYQKIGKQECSPDMYIYIHILKSREYYNQTFSRKKIQISRYLSTNNNKINQNKSKI